MFFNVSNLIDKRKFQVVISFTSEEVLDGGYPSAEITVLVNSDDDSFAAITKKALGLARTFLKKEFVIGD